MPNSKHHVHNFFFCHHVKFGLQQVTSLFRYTHHVHGHFVYFVPVFGFVLSERTVPRKIRDKNHLITYHGHSHTIYFVLVFGFVLSEGAVPRKITTDKVSARFGTKHHGPAKPSTNQPSTNRLSTNQPSTNRLSTNQLLPAKPSTNQPLPPTPSTNRLLPETSQHVVSAVDALGKVTNSWASLLKVIKHNSVE